MGDTSVSVSIPVLVCICLLLIFSLLAHIHQGNEINALHNTIDAKNEVINKHLTTIDIVTDELMLAWDASMNCTETEP